MTTAGITVSENADPDVRADMITGFDRLIPREGGYRHMEGNSAAHLKTALTGTSVTLPTSGGPRRRQLIITILGQ